MRRSCSLRRSRHRRCGATVDRQAAAWRNRSATIGASWQLVAFCG